MYPLCVSHGHQLCSWCSLESAARLHLRGSFNTVLPCAFEEAVMSCNRAHVIIVWILESDVRGKRKLAPSQTWGAKVRRQVGRGPERLKDFPSSVSLFLFLKASLPPWNGSRAQLAAAVRWHVRRWAVIYHNGVIVVIVRVYDDIVLMKYTAVSGWRLDGRPNSSAALTHDSHHLQWTNQNHQSVM